MISASAKSVYEILFGSGSTEFWISIDKAKGVSNKKDTAWSECSLPSKSVECTVPLPFLNVKELEIRATMSFLKKEEGLCYVVEVKSSTTQMIFGDCFTTCVRYCITRVGEDFCQLDISVGVVFNRNTIMKGRSMRFYLGFIRTSALKIAGESVYAPYAKLLRMITKSDVVLSQNPKEDLTISSEEDLPLGIAVPQSALICDCPKHLEKVDVDIIVQASAKKVFDTMFGVHSLSFWSVVDKTRGDEDRKESEWTNDVVKTVSLMMPMDNPMIKLKIFEVKSVMTILKRNEFFVYVVESKSITPDVPYGDCFSNDTRFCIMWNSATSCRIIVSAETTFLKSTMMKGIIKSNASKGQSEKIAQIVQSLLLTVEAQTISSDFVQPSLKLPPFTNLAPISVPANSNFSLSAFKSLFFLLLAFIFGFVVAKFVYQKEQILAAQDMFAIGMHSNKYYFFNYRMREFLKIHFDNSVLTMPNSQYSYLNDNQFGEYQTLSRSHEIVKSVNQDLSEMQGLVVTMQKHLIHSMYLQWREAKLENEP